MARERLRSLLLLPLLLLLALLAPLVVACATPSETRAASAGDGGDVQLPLVADQRVRLAEIALVGQNGASVSGRAALFEVKRGVLVVVDVVGARPGRHAAHLHERGDCSDAASAGGHLNPDGTEHGLPPYLGRHLGDLGNVEVGPNGVGHLEVMLPDANLEPGHLRSVLDRALIIKEEPDDGSQPQGAAHEPIACGVVTDWGVPPGGLIGARYR